MQRRSSPRGGEANPRALLTPHPSNQLLKAVRAGIKGSQPKSDASCIRIQLLADVRSVDRAKRAQESVCMPRYAELLADNRGFSEEEDQYFAEQAQYAYESFRNKAALSRGLPVDQMQEVAQVCAVALPC